MSFKKYLQEQEELAVIAQEKSKKEKIADLFRSIEDINDDRFKSFAQDELGMESEEAETLVYKMLRDFFVKDTAPEMGDELGMGALGLGADGMDGEIEIDLGDELGDELGGIDLGGDEEEIEIDLGGEESPEEEEEEELE